MVCLFMVDRVVYPCQHMLNTNDGMHMEKRQQLIEAAFSLFYREGIHAVGINQILKQAGVAKKTLYAHFESKEALVEAVLTYRDQRFLVWLDTSMQSVKPGKAAILAMFDALDDWFNDRVPTLADFHGCFFINTCSEYSEPSSNIYQQCQRHKLSVHKLIEQQVNQITIEDDNQTLTDNIAMLKEGAIVTAQVLGDKLAAVKAKKLAEALLAADRLILK